PVRAVFPDEIEDGVVVGINGHGRYLVFYRDGGRFLLYELRPYLASAQAWYEDGPARSKNQGMRCPRRRRLQSLWDPPPPDRRSRGTSPVDDRHDFSQRILRAGSAR